MAYPFPPGFDFVPGSDHLLWVANLSPADLVPVDVSGKVPKISLAFSIFKLPYDSDGDGREEGELGGIPPIPFTPILDDLHAISADLALVTASSYEEVLFFALDTGGLKSFDVSVPASFPPGDNPFLFINPGATASQTGISTLSCIRPPSGALDSYGVLYTDTFCDNAAPSFYSSFTSGAAIVGNHLFVSTANLGGGRGTANTQYLPGSVLVYDIDLLASPPTISSNEFTPVIITTGFNPTHVTSFTVGTRNFALITVSGAIGIQKDDLSTPEVEAFAIAMTDSAIDVIDADTLELVATIPLGRAGLSTEGLVVDPTGKIGVVGSAIGRFLLAVDLTPLEELPGIVVKPIVLDGFDGSDAVIFDIDSPFPIPARLNGAPAYSCPGSTVGAAFEGNRLFVTEDCDGTLAVIDIQFSGSPPVPLPTNRFTLTDLIPVVAPIKASTLVDPRRLSSVAVRPGNHPGLPNVFYTVGEPGMLCGIEIN
jgi:hypothetical protein